CGAPRCCCRPSTIRSFRSRASPIPARCRPRCARSSCRTAGTWGSWKAGRGARRRGPSGERGSSSPRVSTRLASVSLTATPDDAYGLPVSTSSDALATYDRAVRALLGWRADALDLFRAAAAQDPGLALAHAGAAVCLFLEERFAETKAASDAARAAMAGQTD